MRRALFLSVTKAGQGIEIATDLDGAVIWGWDVVWQQHVLGAAWRAGDKTIAAGQTATNLGCVVVLISGEAKNYAYFLDHEDEQIPVLMVREGEAGANNFNPGTACKQTLQQQCQP